MFENKFRSERMTPYVHMSVNVDQKHKLQYITEKIIVTVMIKKDINVFTKL